MKLPRFLKLNLCMIVPRYLPGLKTRGQRPISHAQKLRRQQEWQ